jgi:hypothetical protein
VTVSVWGVRGVRGEDSKLTCANAVVECNG